MITVDEKKCCRCGKCVKDCVVNIIQLSKNNGFPFIAPDDEKYCLHCEHCLAICPVGAIECDGKSASDCESLGAIPDEDEFLNLIRQRRSIRQWDDKPISKETIEKLKNALDWTPTGCNVHNLQFIIITSPNKMLQIRNSIYSKLRNPFINFLLKIFYPQFSRYLKEVMSGDDVVFRDSPAMIIALIPKNAPCVNFDPVIALTQFDLYAQTLGLGTCWCGFAQGIFERLYGMKKTLNVPKGYKVGAVMLFGYPSVEYHRATAPVPYTKEIIE